MKRATLSLLAAAAAFSASAVVPDHAWVWRRSGECGDVPFDGKSIELHHDDAQDWSLNCFRRMKVRAGDRFVFSFTSESLSDRRGQVTASAVMRRADGEVSSWYFAPATTRRFTPPTPGELLDWVLVVEMEGL